MPKRIITTPTNPMSKRTTAATRKVNTSKNTQQVDAEPGTNETIDQSSSQQSALASIKTFFTGASSQSTSATASVPTSVGTLTRATSQLSLVSNSSARSNYNRKDAFGGTDRGQMRNLLEIDILSIDGEQLKTNFSEQEIYTKVLRGVLGFSRSEINSVQISWRGHPYVQARLKDMVRINDLAGDYEYKKKGFDENGKETEHIVRLEVRGHREVERGPETAENPDDPWVRWVKIEYTGMDIEEDRLKSLLSRFGSLHSEIIEKTIKFQDEHVGSDDDPDEEVVLGTGKYEVKMLIETHIPQYIPAFSRKFKFHYRGIEKQCTNCYLSGHYKSSCENERVEWIEYVIWFKQNFPEIGPEMLGRWSVLASIHANKLRSAQATHELVKTQASQQEPTQEPPEATMKTRKSTRTQPTKGKSGSKKQ